jgi:rhodanese-related sulfurtransferase
MADINYIMGNIAAEELCKCGFQAVNLEGGFEAWNKLNQK